MTSVNKRFTSPPNTLFLSRMTLRILFLSFLSLPTSALPTPARNTDIPYSAQGDAFISAWTFLRKNADTLSHGSVHPLLFDAWLNQLPRFALRDIIRFATEPQVLLGAAVRLARGADNADAALLEALAQRYYDAPLGFAFAAAAFASGNTLLRKRIKENLTSTNDYSRFEAERCLAAAMDPNGLKAMMKRADRCDAFTTDALKTIGSFGSEASISALNRLHSQSCAQDNIRSARGEILLRRKMPQFYTMILRRDPSGNRFRAQYSMYDTWFIVSELAFDSGISTQSDLLSFVDSRAVRAMDWGGNSEEVIHRQLAEMREFLTDVITLSKQSAAAPVWPDNLVDAIDVLSLNTKKSSASALFAKKLDASIYILKETTRMLHHPEREFAPSFLQDTSPGAERLFDGNFLSVLRVKKNDVISMKFDGPVSISKVYLANSCAGERSHPIGRIRITTVDSTGKPSDISTSLPLSTRYYQPISIAVRNVTAIRLTIEEISGDSVACISEVRIEN